MAVETKYVCDRCGTDSADKTHMRQVGVVVREIHNMYLSQQQVKRDTLWCHTCLIQMGLSIPKTKEERDLETPDLPTIPDLIRELVREELENFEP